MDRGEIGPCERAIGDTGSPFGSVTGELNGYSGEFLAEFLLEGSLGAIQKESGHDGAAGRCRPEGIQEHEQPVSHGMVADPLHQTQAVDGEVGFRFFDPLQNRLELLSHFIVHTSKLRPETDAVNSRGPIPIG
jgi:hypothetical protein